MLSVGGLYKLKGHQLIIQALKKLVESGRDSVLWIVGSGYYKQKLENTAKEFGVFNRVVFLGALGHTELAKAYNSCDVFVLANFQEITPAVNEALACAKPVVIMECGGYEFVLPNENYGLVSKKFDVEDMTRKIIKVLDDKKLAKKIAANGRKRVLENFSIEKVAQKFYRVFK